jgi:O-antigen/teichoic acid export membrane protein
MDVRKIFENSLWYGIVPRLSSLATIFLMPIITPYLTKNDYGAWGIINSYTGLIVSVCSLGLHTHLSNSFYEYARNEHYKLVWRRLFFLMYISSFFFSAILAAVIYYELKNEVQELLWPVIVVSIIPILCYPNQVIVEHYCVLTERPRLMALRNFFVGLISVAVMYLTIGKWHLGYIGWLISAAVSGVLLFLLFFKEIWIVKGFTPCPEQSWRRIKSLFKISLPVIPHNLGHSLLTTSDRIVMGFMAVSIADIGLYTNGYQMGNYLNMVSSGLLMSISPHLQTAYRRKDFAQMRRIYGITQIPLLSLIFIIALWMPEIYFILIRNSKLHEAIPLATILTFTLSSTVIYSFMSVSAFINKKTITLLWLVFGPAVVNITLNTILIPFFGYKSAAWSAVIARLSICLLPFFHSFYRGETKAWLGKYMWLLLVLPIFCLTSILVIYYWLGHAGILVKLCMTFSLCLIVLAYLIYVSSLDKEPI